MSAPPSATRPNLTADPSVWRTAPGLAVDEGFGPGIAMRAADGHDPGLAACGKPAGVDRLGRSARASSPDVSRSAPRPTSPRQINPSAGAPMMPSSGVPLVTSARLTVNSLRPATNSLVPSSGSIRKKLPSIGRLRQMDALLGQRRYLGSQPRQTFADDPVGGEIRLRHRRSVDLAVDLHRRPVDGENGGAGPDHEIGQGLHQRGRGIAIDHGS